MSEPYKRPKRVIPLRDDDLLFSVSMAAAFFDLSAAALRKKEKYLFDSMGNPIEIAKTPGGDRRYSLNDILKIAHALRRANKMTDRQLRLIVLRVDAFKEPVLKHRLKFRKGGNPS
jgi:uncharacterized Ntn-hydrolase superfamily protein